MTFTELAREHGNCTVEGLSPVDQQELVGAYLVENYGEPDGFEPLIESVTPEHMERLHQIMADDGCASVWVLETIRLMTKNYLGLVQEALNKANEEPWWESANEDGVQGMKGWVDR